ncbi:hypothetical protein B0H11DRAFT_1720142 [Mycena galericulata]|nr:hypothetical protein B0H11DRAFT_1733075 [Mycena galericulata]KAJ7489624.1 hypothetical protein B0H11DRAFT_1720142 [Mycena galericulata]
MYAESVSPDNSKRTTPTPRRSPPTPVVDAEVLLLDFVYRRKSRSILNCTVVGRDGYTPYFHIVTCLDVHPGRTLFRTNEGRTIAVVEWGGKGDATYVEVHKAVTKQRVSEWLRVSGDASHRMMRADGETYVWAPQGNSICVRLLFVPAHSIPNLLARIEKGSHTVRLEISLEAVSRGLVGIAVVATMVFQSGCRID